VKSLGKEKNLLLLFDWLYEFYMEEFNGAKLLWTLQESQLVKSKGCENSEALFNVERLAFTGHQKNTTLSYTIQQPRGSQTIG